MIDAADCEHPNGACLVTTVKRVEAEVDEGIYVLFAQDFDDPDAVEVEVFCPTCGLQRLLRPDEWEVA